MTVTPSPDWIALDWQAGTLRFRAMQSGRAVAEKAVPCHADRRALEAAIAERLADWKTAPDTPLFMSGWPVGPEERAADVLRKVPCPPLEAAVRKLTLGPFTLQLVPGLRQDDPPGVMQGEETRIAGFLSLNANWDGVICLPGETTVWAQVSADEVVSFQTTLTGRLAALLEPDACPPAGSEAFDTALAATLSRPEKLATRLSGINAARSLGAEGKDDAQALLWGALIGAELAATRAYWLGTQIAIIGETAISALYARALATQGAPATVADPERMTLAGLTRAHRLNTGSE